MNRRSVLTLIVATPLSGCLAMNGRVEKQISWIQLENKRAEPHTVEVVIEERDEKRFSAKRRLGTGPESATVRVNDPVDGRGHYTVRFLADDQWMHIEPTEYEGTTEQCLGIRFVLHRQGTMGYEIRAGDEC